MNALRGAADPQDTRDAEDAHFSIPSCAAASAPNVPLDGACQTPTRRRKRFWFSQALPSLFYSQRCPFPVPRSPEDAACPRRAALQRASSRDSRAQTAPRSSALGPAPSPATKLLGWQQQRPPTRFCSPGTHHLGAGHPDTKGRASTPQNCSSLWQPVPPAGNRLQPDGEGA